MRSGLAAGVRRLAQAKLATQITDTP